MAVVFGRREKAKASKKGSSETSKQPAREKPLEEEDHAALSHVVPKQCATSGRPKIFLEIAIFRGAFFGVDHQEALEFELHPEAAPKATRRLLEDCAADRLRDRRFAPVTAMMAVLGGGDLGEPEAETGEGLRHTEPGMLSVSRKNDFAGYILTLAASPRLDRDHAAFGRLCKGAEFLQHIREARDSDCKEVRVVNCGEVLRDLDSRDARSRSPRK
eukprot:symbB.v1.2.000475.t1/scaffold11.1/size528188/24